MSTTEVSETRHTYRQQFKFLRQVWASDVYGIERVAMLALLAARLATPFLLLSHLFWSDLLWRRKRAIDIYVFVTMAFQWAILFAWPSPSPWAVGLVVYLLADLYVALLSGIFLSKPGLYGFPVSLNRSLLLLLVNYLHIVAAFGALYLHTAAVCQCGVGLSDPVRVLYFSAITTVTVGYGDIIPCTTTGYAIAAIHTFAAFVFAACVLSLYVSRVKLEGPPQA